MRRLFLLLICTKIASALSGQTLKDCLGAHFLVGAAVNVGEVWGRIPGAQEVIGRHFNALVAENCMKAESLHPEENRYFWDDADQTVRFGIERGMAVIGHCLVWHSQVPRWMFVDAEGQEVSREVLISRMRSHIHEVVGRYRGCVRGWDVINEAFNDDGTLRQTPYLRIIGPAYFELAFRFAHEADPDAELYYNDYSMALPAKRDAVCRMVRTLRSKGCRIDAVGMQSHVGLDYPDLAEYEQTIDSLAACGVKVMVTELDVNVLPNPWDFGGAEVSQHYAYEERMNPYPEGLPEEVEQRLEQRYLSLFALYRRHASQISRVTLWGVSDTNSWLNGWPIPGRTNYPLLFDRRYRPKPVVDKIIGECE